MATYIYNNEVNIHKFIKLFINFCYDLVKSILKVVEISKLTINPINYSLTAFILFKIKSFSAETVPFPLSAVSLIARMVRLPNGTVLGLVPTPATSASTTSVSLSSMSWGFCSAQQPLWLGFGHGHTCC